MSSKTVTSADGTTIYADAVGDRNKQHLIFLHGLTSNATVFDPLFTHPKLLKQFYMVRYESRGHGRSGKPQEAESYTSRKFAEDWEAVAQAFGLVRPIHVGWSIGAAIPADILSFLPPGTLAGIVNLCGFPYHGAIINQVGTPFLGELASGITSNDTTTALKLRTALGPELIHTWDKLPFTVQLQVLGSTVLLQPNVAEHVLGRTSDPTALYAAGKASGDAAPLPILYIHGKDDCVLDTTKIAGELAREFEDYTEVLLNECKHAVFIDQTEAVVNALVRFGDKVFGQKKVPHICY